MVEGSRKRGRPINNLIDNNEWPNNNNIDNFLVKYKIAMNEEYILTLPFDILITGFKYISIYIYIYIYILLYFYFEYKYSI